MPRNQYWERSKNRLVHGPLQALLTAVINISKAIEGPEDSTFARNETEGDRNQEARHFDQLPSAKAVLEGSINVRFRG